MICLSVPRSLLLWGTSKKTHPPPSNAFTVHSLVPRSEALSGSAERSPSITSEPRGSQGRELRWAPVCREHFLCAFLHFRTIFSTVHCFFSAFSNSRRCSFSGSLRAALR